MSKDQKRPDGLGALQNIEQALSSSTALDYPIKLLIVHNVIELLYSSITGIPINLISSLEISANPERLFQTRHEWAYKLFKEREEIVQEPTQKSTQEGDKRKPEDQGNQDTKRCK